MADISAETEIVAVDRPSLTSYRLYRPRYRENHPRPTRAPTSFDWWRSIFNHDSEHEENVIRGGLSIDLNKLQNRRSHNTSHYEAKNLILRRGQPFSFDVRLNDVEFDPKADQLTLEFATGDNPRIKDGTLSNVKVYPSKREVPRQEGSWQAFITSSSRAKVEIEVTPPSDAIVSSYLLTVKLYTTAHKRYIERCEEDIYVIFNPWCQDDQVYLSDEAERREYVLQDTGRMYVGDHNSLYGRPWRYGQFDKVCLEAAYYLLDRSNLLKQGHGNVTKVCRALTSQLNSKDNYGVLVGNWTGSYPGGVSPNYWNGSVSILEKYMQEKQPVKYGQCWVFSGLMTTICRALGIPCRSITNFLSGIDRDMSNTIDWYVNEDLEPLYDMDESRWNFHVWNEGWFKRPDLPAGYDGWQAMDSCPQDSMVSDGLHCCGPAPLRAIKEGNVFLSYDAGFLFAEVNGDQVTWIVKRNGEVSPVKSYSQFNYIGKKISTKEVGRNIRNDITHLYKHPEGSADERQAAERAASHGSHKTKLLEFFDDNTENDVLFNVVGKTLQNGDVEIKLIATNESHERRSLELRLTATATYYTGATGEEVATAKHTTDLSAKQEKSIVWTLPAELYLNAIDEDALVKAWVTARVRQTGQMFFNTETFDVDKPDLIIQLDKKRVRVGEDVEITVKFENPLDVKLLNGVLVIEGLGTNKNIKVPIHRGIRKDQTLTERVKMTPRYPGNTEIIASLNFRQLTGICGSVEIEIVE